jgi:hypothetical protein
MAAQLDWHGKHDAAAFQNAYGQLAVTGLQHQPQCRGRNFAGRARRTEHDREYRIAFGGAILATSYFGLVDWA